MGKPHLRLVWSLFSLCVIVNEGQLVSGAGNIPTGMCERIFVDADPNYVGYVQLGGAYSLQPFTWSDFPVFKHEQHDLFLHFDRARRQMLIGTGEVEWSGLGATVKTTFSDTNWLSRGSTPFLNVIDRWFYYDYARRGTFYVNSNADLGPRCIPDDVQFRPCSSGKFAFNQVIRQDLSNGQFVYINQLNYYYERLAGVYRYSRPIFLRGGSGAATAYLFYSETFSGWVVGPDYNTDSVFMYVTTSVLRPEFITETWNVYTNTGTGQFQPNNGISLDCRGILTNRTCAQHNPCKNNGTCHQKDGNEAICDCTTYFTGQFCEKIQQPVCPSLQDVHTSRIDGALATRFCQEGYSPSHYFAVCRGPTTGAISPLDTGEWISDGSCSKTTTPPMTTTTWSSWSSWNAWSSWNSWSSGRDRYGGDSGSSSSDGKSVEPSGLWIFTLVLVLTVTLILPFAVYGILKCKEEPDEPERETLVEMVAIPEPSQDQDQHAAGDLAIDSSQPEDGNTQTKQKQKMSRSRVRNISLARILSISSFCSLWFYFPWVAVCFTTTCGIYSSSMVTLALFGVIVMPFAYLFMLFESIFSREKAYLSKLGEAGTVGRLVSQMRQAQPIVTWRAVCYHFETRTRTVYYTDGQGNTQSRQETYTEQVVTHIDFETFFFNYWSDESAEQMEGVSKFGVTRIRLDKSISPGDIETSTVYSSQFEEFKKRNEHMDKFMDVGVETGVPGFEKRVAAFVDENTASWWMKMRFFVLATVLGLTWPYRWFFRAKTGKTYYTIVKKLYMTRPDVGDVNPYDVAIGERSEREVRQSIAVSDEAAAGIAKKSGTRTVGSSDREDETSIAVGVTGPSVHVAL